MIFNTIFWNMDFLCVWTAVFVIDRSRSGWWTNTNFNWISLTPPNPMKIMPRIPRIKNRTKNFIVKKKTYKSSVSIGNSIFLNFGIKMITVGENASNNGKIRVESMKNPIKFNANLSSETSKFNMSLKISDILVSKQSNFCHVD